MKITSSEATALRQHLNERHGEILSLTRALVEQESPSGDLEGSRAVVDLLVREAERINAVTSVERIPAGNYGEHLRICAFGGAQTNEQTTLLIGHTDTVHPRGSIRQRAWREAGDLIYAPGIFDMKANCALALAALRACDELALKPARTIVVLLTCDEETGSATGRPLVEAEAQRAHAALVLEPPASHGRVKTARKGTAGYTLTTIGCAAHAGLEPEKGASAILEMARQIERLHALNDVASGTTVNVGVVSGGTRSNVVAAEARAEVDVRFSTRTEAQRIETTLRELQPFDKRVRISIEGEINRLPMERTPAVIKLYEHARLIAAALDFELGEASVGGGSDGNFVAALGVPVLDGLGIDGDGAHADHEHINTSGIALRGALLAGLMASL